MTSNVLLGGDILGLITAGMYNDPMVVYREYIQNAADAIFAKGNSGGVISVGIDVVGSRLTIQDNGTGLTPQDAAKRLVQIGSSTKTLGLDRGFRGIGRLSALAFADSVTFTTRTCFGGPCNASLLGVV